MRCLVLHFARSANACIAYRPNGIEDYIHRIGRTGRAGRTGTAYSYVTTDQGRKQTRIVSRLLRLTA